MQKRTIILSFLLAVLLIAFAYAAGSGTNDDSQTSTLQNACSRSGGTWQEFPNTCADSCELARNPETVQCGLVLTNGCECGETKCWNGQNCILTEQTEQATKRTICANGGGRLASTTCMNSCEFRRARANGENPQCTQELLENCACGANKCWDGQTCVAISDSSSPIRPCADLTQRTDRIKCRLENRADTANREPEWSSEESCKNLTETISTTETRTRITKGLCRALYSTSKQCYEMQEEGNATKEEVEKCFQRAAGLEKRVSEEFQNKEGVRKYLVLRLYNLQEKIETAQEEGEVDAQKAAEAIELTVQIKEKIMNGENKETIRPLVAELKTKLQEMKSNE